VSNLSEIERDIVEAAIGMAIGPHQDGIGMMRLRLLDAHVGRLLKIRADDAGLSVDDYIKRERTTFMDSEFPFSGGL
jgi:hypothetical protein